MTFVDAPPPAAVMLARRVVVALDLPSALAPGGRLDKYALQSEPGLLRDVAAAMAALAPVDGELFGGLELAGVPLAAAMSLVDGRPFAVVRRASRPPSNAITAGAPVAGRRVVLVKDMVRTGAALTAVGDALRAAGATVTDVVCAVCWDPAAANMLARAGLTLHPLLTLADLRAAWSPSP